MDQPTRTNLLLLKEHLAAVQNCATILKGRRQALIKEFLQISRPLMQSREEVATAYGQALAALEVSRAREGPAAITALATASRREPAIEVIERNLLGLRYQDLICHESVVRPYQEQPFDVYGSSVWLEETIETFSGIVEEMLALASFEGKFRRLAEELVRLTRRIRVLEERIAPGLQQKIRTMDQYLAERERETYFRLKRFKQLRGERDR